MKDLKLAALQLPRYVLFGSALFIGIVFILAFPLRFSARFSAIFNQFNPLNVKPGAHSNLASVQPLATSTMASAVFKQPPQPPPVFVGTMKSIVEDTNRLVEMSRNLQDKIVAEIKPEQASFRNVILPMAHDDNNAALESHILGFYQAVSPDKALRDASTEADKLLDEFSIESSMREDVFELVEAVFKKDEALDPESRRLLEKNRKNYIRNGLNLSAGPKRDRFKDIKKRLSQLSIQFQKNLNEENGGIWFTKEDLDGVPEDLLSILTKGDGENAGKLRLSFKYPDLFPTLKYATNSDTRKKVLIDNENKCNQNVPLFREAVLLRDEAARLLGYPNHAAFRIEDKMAKTPATVDAFLGDLRQRLTDGGKNEVRILKELKEEFLKSKGQSFDGRYWLWDHRYYSRIQLERDYKLDQQKVAEYFPLQTTLSSMLRIFEELLGLKFIEVTGETRDAIAPSGKGEDIVWHPDVQVFSVWNDESEGGGFVGYLYTDLHPRDGKCVLVVAREQEFPWLSFIVGTATPQTSTSHLVSLPRTEHVGIQQQPWSATSANRVQRSPACLNMTRSLHCFMVCTCMI